MSQDTPGPGNRPSNNHESAGPEWSWLNGAVILLFALLTLLGMALASGWLDAAVAITGPGEEDTMTIPIYVHLYAGLGALGYIFTKLMVEFEAYAQWRQLNNLVEMGLRIPAAWILATGLYLFVGDLGQTSGTGGATFAAGVSFLVGLYVNVSLKALGSLADRILGRTPRTTGDGENST